MLTAKLLLAYLLSSNIAVVGIDTSSIDLEQAYCLAKNIYYEAGNEDIRGQFAVASVTVNRVNDKRFPDTICDVVKQTTTHRVTKRVVCQFSWYCDGKSDEIPVRNNDGSVNQRVVDQFMNSSIVAIKILSGKAKDNTGGATHFHNPFISQPAWKFELKKTASVGNHDFYKLPGKKNNVRGI